MVGQGDGLAFGPGRIAGRVVGLIRYGIPLVQVFKYPADDGGLINNSDNTHGVVAFWAL